MSSSVAWANSNPKYDCRSPEKWCGYKCAGSSSSSRCRLPISTILYCSKGNTSAKDSFAASMSRLERCPRSPRMSAASKVKSFQRTTQGFFSPAMRQFGEGSIELPRAALGARDHRENECAVGLLKRGIREDKSWPAFLTERINERKWNVDNRERFIDCHQSYLPILSRSF